MTKPLQITEDLLQISRLALTTSQENVQMYIQKMIRRYNKELPELARQIDGLLKQSKTKGVSARGSSTPQEAIPVDMDSRLHLLRFDPGTNIEIEPIFSESIKNTLNQMIQERRHSNILSERGLLPAKSAIFTGPPGVGKTLAAKWLARELGIPLLTLDLSAVMSSFLGRTGNNLRFVLDYAKKNNSILFLDELDAIAKRRDDTSEIGELKRLVTVLLQEIDNWSTGQLLIAACNHPDLLDPAIWRRFDVVIEFPLPDRAASEAAIISFLGSDHKEVKRVLIKTLAQVFSKTSFSEIERLIKTARKQAIITNSSITNVLLDIIKLKLKDLDKDQKLDQAVALVKNNIISQREACELTGISRDTIRKTMN